MNVAGLINLMRKVKHALGLATVDPADAELASGRRRTARVVNMITCPHCGSVLPEVMEEDTTVIFIYCSKCHDRIDTRLGDCCVFRSYGQDACFHSRS